MPLGVKEKKAALLESYGKEMTKFMLGFVSKVEGRDEWIIDSGEIDLQNGNAINAEGKIADPNLFFLVLSSGGIYGAQMMGNNMA